jgi:cytochrome P450
MSTSPAALRVEADLPYLDVLGEEFQRNPDATLAALRGTHRFAFSRRGVEVLRYDDVSALVRDERFDAQSADTYARMGAPDSLVTFAANGLLVAMAGETHHRIRRVFSAGFRVSQVEKLRSEVRAIAVDLLGEWVGDECEFVADFSKPFPMHVLCRLLGVPVEDIPLFTHAATEMHLLAAVPLAPGFPRVDAALTSLTSYVGDLVASRRRSPAEDIISSLIAVQSTEGRLSDDELALNLVNLIFAGQDTTRYQLASAVRLVAEAPGMWDQLAADPTAIPLAVEEALRLAPVTRFIVRIPRTDVELADVRVAAGRRVILNLLSASRDAERFDEPDRFVLRPAGEQFDVPFGWGMHHCLGAQLARIEMQEALAVLVAAVSEVELVGRPSETSPAAMLHGPERMQIRYRRRASSAPRSALR